VAGGVSEVVAPRRAQDPACRHGLRAAAYYALLIVILRHLAQFFSMRRCSA